MNYRFLSRAVLFFGLLITAFSSKSQRIVTSTAGYQVSITIIPIAILPSTFVCPYGYNYNVRFSYIVSFSGINIPANLYTLQGNIGCGSNSHFFSLPKSGGVGILSTSSNQWRAAPDCATATIQSVLCSNVVVRISGLGIPSQNVTVPVSLVILPVKVSDFTAVQEKERVQIKWLGENQTASAHFTLERSQDGVQFAAITSLSNNRNSANPNQYRYYDAPPAPGFYYYRLKQQDSDGKVQFSEICCLHFNPTKRNITVFPMYSKGNTIEFSGLDQLNHYELNVVGMSGINVYRSRLNSSVAVLPFLNPGRYLLRLINRETGETTNLNYIQL